MILLISFFLAGCGHVWIATPTNFDDRYTCRETGAFPQLVKVPAFKNVWQMVHDCRAQRREKTSLGMLAFYKEWVITFGDPTGEVYKVIDGLLIEWGNEYKTANGYSIHGNRVRLGRVKGRALPPTMIWMYAHPHQLVCESSLVHELVHVAIWTKTRRHSDPDHEGIKWPGWTKKHTQLIKRVNQQLCELGI